MDDSATGTLKGILLLQEMLQNIWDYQQATFEGRTDKRADLQVKAYDICWRLHLHLVEQAAIPGNESLPSYEDSAGHTVKDRLNKQAGDLELVPSGKRFPILVLDRIRGDINASDAMKQLLVCGGPFTDGLNDLAKFAGFALKLTSGRAYADPEKAAAYDVRDAIQFLEFVAEVLRRNELLSLKFIAQALSYRKLEWSGLPPKD